MKLQSLNMLRTFLIVLILWSAGLIACTSQRQKPLNPPKLSAGKSSLEMQKDSTCCFDIKKYNERRIKEGRYDFEFTEGNKIIRQRYSFSSDSDGKYIEDISKKWSPFNIQKRYDNLGRLKFWGMYFRNECIKKSYEYDDKGRVINITDCDKNFKHDFADIRELLLKERGIDIFDVRQAIARRVYHKNPGSTEAYYDINVRDKKDDEKDYKIIVNDDTLEMKEYRN